MSRETFLYHCVKLCELMFYTSRNTHLLNLDSILLFNILYFKPLASKVLAIKLVFLLNALT